MSIKVNADGSFEVQDIEQALALSARLKLNGAAAGTRPPPHFPTRIVRGGGRGSPFTRRRPRKERARRAARPHRASPRAAPVERPTRQSPGRSKAGPHDGARKVLDAQRAPAAPAPRLPEARPSGRVESYEQIVDKRFPELAAKRLEPVALPELAGPSGDEDVAGGGPDPREGPGHSPRGRGAPRRERRGGPQEDVGAALRARAFKEAAEGRARDAVDDRRDIVTATHTATFLSPGVWSLRDARNIACRTFGTRAEVLERMERSAAAAVDRTSKTGWGGLRATAHARAGQDKRLDKAMGLEGDADAC
jgi:hypothetical protein